MIQIPKLIALVDMDDTLCDYSGTLYADHQKISSLMSIFVNTLMEIFMTLLRFLTFGSATKLIRRVPGWWRNLPKRPEGFRILQILQEYDYDIHILTKASLSYPAAWSEKVDWCQEHVPTLSIAITRDKSLVYGKVLVDDYPGYIMEWLQHRPRGIVVMPEYPWNKNFVHPQVIHCDGSESAFEIILEKLDPSNVKLGKQR